jgi:hypothetical protein
MTREIPGPTNHLGGHDHPCKVEVYGTQVDMAGMYLGSERIKLNKPNLAMAFHTSVFH